MFFFPEDLSIVKVFFSGNSSRPNLKTLASFFKFRLFSILVILSSRYQKLNSVYKQNYCKRNLKVSFHFR